jgi:predicted MPP superfamily phosphohydrolase
MGFVSDVHLGPTTPAPLLAAAFGHLARARLDVLLLGGDYVFLDATESKARLLADFVRGVPAPKKLAVLGNHDLWTHHALLEQSLGEAGVQLLLNGSTPLGAPWETVRVVGLDDPWTGQPDASEALRDAGDADALVVLCHSPDGLPEIRRGLARFPRRRPILYACGHTHGGHVAAPWGPVVVPGRVGKQYPAGLHDVGDMHLHVSRGVGGVEVPIRTYARPDVVIFDLVSRSP